MDPTTSNRGQHYCKWRALVVENDPVMRHDLVKNLARWGYEVASAEGKGQALLDDARKKARELRCHVALIDMRLLDDDDCNDTSGLQLVLDLKPTVSVVASAYGDLATAREALKEKQASDFVGKEEGPERLREVIHKAIRNTCCCDLDIPWYPNHEPCDILHGLELNSEEIPIDEPRCVLGRLYARREGKEPISLIDLKPITEYYRSPTDTTPLVRSVVFVARAQGENDQWHQAEIIKLALKEQIQAEIKNYHTYVGPFLPPHRTARIEDQKNAVVLWDIGGIRYTNIATENRRPLRQWYGSVETERITRALEDLFAKTLGRWYSTASQQSGVDTVYDYYVRQFSKLGPRINNYPDQSRYSEIVGAPHRLRNPVAWTRAHGPQSRFITRWRAHTHGDLHSENIFVDEHDQTCVIDYERSGPGHFLRDFVELETDVRLRLLPLTQDELPLAYHLDILLLAPERPDQNPCWKDIPGTSEKTQAELRKAFDVISTLRQLASRLTQFEQMDEYYWALLMETLISVVRNYPAWKNQEAAELAKNRALLSSALLCERLARWGRPWPPEEWLPLEKATANSGNKKVSRHPSADTPPQSSGASLSDHFAHGHALLIGVGHTLHGPRWSLPVTVQDAAEVRNVLVDPDVCAYLPEHVRLLHDETASITYILDGMKWLAGQARSHPDATIVVYFSGHGWRHQDGRYALIPSDVKPDDLQNSVLWAEKFTNALRDIKSRRLLVLIDACHAEGMSTAKGEETLMPAGFAKTPPPPELLSALKHGEGRAVISSSRGHQFSYVRSDGRLSIFTHHLLEALHGAANLPGETTVRISNLINHLGKAVPATTRTQWQAEQTPWTDQASEDFPIALLLGGKGLAASSTTPVTRSKYNVPAIRNLLKDALNDEALTDLCQDHFPDVYRGFSVGMSTGQKIRILLDYSERYLLFDALLQHVREINPTQFAHYEAQLHTG